MTQAIFTCDEQYSQPALAEFQATFPDAEHSATLAPGVELMTFTGPFSTSAELWRQAPPRFVRHLCPVDRVVPLAGTETDLDALQQALQQGLVVSMPTSLPFSVQTRIFSDDVTYKPFTVNGRLSKAVKNATEAKLDVRQPQQIVSVVIAQSAETLTGYVGVSSTFHNLSDWAGGARRFKREAEQVSRSEFKLLEALAVFDLKLPSQGRALDLGAAPGGWSRLLRQAGLVVVAVDPAELDQRVAGDWSVWHAQESAESYLKRADKEPFDLLTCDLSADAKYSAHIVDSYARLLKPRAPVIMTLQLPRQQMSTTLDRALATLSVAYTVEGVRHLFHNRHDITVYLRRRAA